MQLNTPVLPEPWLSTEDRLLLCCAHPSVSPERREQLTRLLVSPLDWSQLLEQADRHGMGPLLYRHIGGMADATFPSEALGHRARISLVRNLCLHSELVRLLGEFNRAGIAVMPLKGPLLTDLLYGDLSLRPMGDIDLLVRPEDLTKGEQVLLRAGCTRARPPQQEADLYHQSYVTNGGGDTNVLVELHWDLAKSHTARLDVRQVWASASPVLWEGRKIWTMALPDLFLYLCLHAVKDGLGSLRTLLDIALLVERFGKLLTWEELAEAVRTSQTRTPVYMSLLQARKLLGADIPVEFLTAIRPPRGVGWFLGQALFTWRGGILHTPPTLLEGPMMTLLMLLWEDSLRGKLRHLGRILFPSASLLARWMPLSSSSSLFRWYSVWLWRACSQLARQMTTGRKPEHTTLPRN